MQIDIQQLCKQLNIPSLTPMQEEVLVRAKQAGDLHLISPTGTGKTLAFILGMLQDWEEQPTSLQSIVVSPTRELAQQIDSVFRQLNLPAKTLCVYGGHSLKIEAQSLNPTPQLIIGTPGRLLDHFERGNIPTDNIHSLVFDEFDKTLELGFHDEVAAILQHVRSSRKIFSSATNLETWPDFLQPDSLLSVNYVKDHLAIDFIEHTYRSGERLTALIDVLCAFPKGKTIVFCNFRDTVELLVEDLKAEGVFAKGFHGALEQDERNRAIVQFRNGSYDILVATDLAARGLDIEAVETVIHFELPPKSDAFVHRNGRTGRMDASGRVVILTDIEKEHPEFFPAQSTPLDTSGATSLPCPPNNITLYLSGGKKDKINKIDIVGFLTKKGGLVGKEVGLIHVFDHASYVAIPRKKEKEVLSRIRREKIKGKRLKIERSR